MNAVYSQEDTMIFSKEKNYPEDDKYDTLYKQFVKDQDQEIRHLWKINLVDLSILMPNLDFEQKLGKLWSSESYLKLGIITRDDYKGVFSQWEVSQQLKLYYNLNRRERHGKKTNGFSGNYFSLILFASNHDYPKPGFQNTFLMTEVSYYGAGIHYGLQRRIGNTGYFEIFAGMHYNYQQLSEYTDRIPFFEFPNSGSAGGWKFSEAFGVKAGFAISSFSNRVKPPWENDQAPEAKRIWKLNLLGYGPLMPDLGFEFRLGKNWTSDSYLQLGTDAHAQFDIREFPLQIEFEQQLKYYVNIIRRQGQGHKPNNFSGEYFSGSLFVASNRYDYEYDDPESSFFIPHVFSTNKSYGAGVKYGMQCRIGNIGYFDVFAGINYQVKEVPVNIVRVEKGGGYFEYRVRKTTRQGFIPSIGIKAGFAVDSNSKLMRILK